MPSRLVSCSGGVLWCLYDLFEKRVAFRIHVPLPGGRLLGDLPMPYAQTHLPVFVQIVRWGAMSTSHPRAVGISTGASSGLEGCQETS